MKAHWILRWRDAFGDDPPLPYYTGHDWVKRQRHAARWTSKTEAARARDSLREHPRRRIVLVRLVARQSETS